MKAKFILLSILIIVMSSFKNSKENDNRDAGCNISFTLVGASGCTCTVSGTVDCGAMAFGNAMSTFTGSITFGGESGCPTGTVNVAYAVPAGGGWGVPTGSTIAFYKTDGLSDCETGGIVFIGTPDSKVNLLNSLSRAFLEEFQKDLGC
jgi:hypothetical protein